MRLRTVGRSGCGATRINTHLLIGLIPVLIVAPAASGQQNDDPHIERMTVVGERVYPVVDTIAPSTEAAVDTAELLRQLPGANLNANGALTGIAQYRGLYGDRVAVNIDGLRTATGGPNAMDAPLSYASPLLLDHLSVERGIASVSSAPESFGGHVQVEHDRGQNSAGKAFALAGKAQARVASNGGLNSTAMQLVGANNTHKLALLSQRDRSDDLDFPGGKLTPTRLQRDRYDLSYAYQGDDLRALVYTGRLDTQDTGTPSLPMDIRSIFTDMYGVRVSTDLSDKSTLEFAFNNSDIDHVMDNFGLRTPPASPMSYRSTHAVSDANQWRVGSRTKLMRGALEIGVDGETSDHTATITNPSVAPFGIENFNAAERDIVGLYGQWNREQGKLDLELGLRVNHVTLDSGLVSASIPAMNPMMQMMGMNAAMLASAFNSSDLSRTHDNVDAVFKIGRVLGGTRNVYFEVARKSRAPSYQEMYLWLPLEATGGLADGRSYIGNPALKSETAREINFGSNWQTKKSWFAPQIFYKDIADYIQGVPATNPTANMVANMMTGQPALEFANTDAEIYGIDIAWGFYLTEALVLDGVLTSVSGRRTDVKDNLYRLAPLNGRIGLTYEANKWLARVEAVGYAAQNKVASFNDEAPTSGYGLLNATLQWQMRPSWALAATMANVLDKRYQDHLDGINRVTGADVGVGQRLFGTGRSLQVGLRVSW